jgi:hypothetical protein
VESCDFFNEPKFLRPAVLPLEYREQIIADLQHWIDHHHVDHSVVLNIRNPNVAQQQIVQDLQSYVNYLKSEPDQSWRLPDLVEYLKRLESNRGNSIITYLPEYEDLFRSSGY